MTDRLSFAPRHEGDFVLPCDSVFNRLVVYAQRHDLIAVRDINTGDQKTFAELLGDVLILRNALRSRLAPSVLQDLKEQKAVYITLLAAGGYEFTVGAFAILALGAVISPVSVAQPLKEIVYYVNEARSVAIVTSNAAFDQGQALVDSISASHNSCFIHARILEPTQRPSIPTGKILLSSNVTTDPEKASLVIFTSGTTGAPKGAVLRHAAISDTALIQASRLGLQAGDVLLHVLPVHHATGIWVSFFPFLLTGCCIEFRSGSFDPLWTWNRFRQGQVTHFSGVPTIYMRMMRYYTDHIARLPSIKQKSFANAVQSLKVMMCGSSALPRPIDAFWSDLLGHEKRIIQRYGSTELYVVFDTPSDPVENCQMPDGSVGKPVPGVDVKLVSQMEEECVNGSVSASTTSKHVNNLEEEGEIYVRSPHMFSKYLNNPAATRSAHDSQGYFRSGDLAKRSACGQWYFITGRANIDIIKSGGYKISALDVEREILSLPFVNEVMVVGVPDTEFGQRVAAVISLRDESVAQRVCSGVEEPCSPNLTIEQLRSALRERLAGYKLPTLLKVIEGELPKNPTGKVVKKQLGPMYFPADYHKTVRVQTWNSRPRARL